jgi:hypothetical protein
LAENIKVSSVGGVRCCLVEVSPPEDAMMMMMIDDACALVEMEK